MSSEELRRQLNMEIQLMEQTVAEIEHALPEVDSASLDTLRRAGFGALLMNLYNGIENILMRIARFEGIPIPTGDRWHIELFNTFTKIFPSGRKALFDPDLQARLRGYRDFRHVMVHGYGVILKWELMRGLVAEAPAAFREFRGKVGDYMRTLQDGQ